MSEAHRIICFGDSITEGGSIADIDRWTGVLQLVLEGEFPGRFRIYNRGVSGNTTAQALERIDLDIKPHLPGTVLMQFGLNDSNVRSGREYFRVGPIDFEANLTEINRYVQVAGEHAFSSQIITEFIKRRRSKETEKRRPRLPHFSSRDSRTRYSIKDPRD